jgi:hypothetical protein
MQAQIFLSTKKNNFLSVKIFYMEIILTIQICHLHYVIFITN